MFLGYNDKYKGYRCLLPSRGRVYISRHVIFDESIFPFASAYQKYHPSGATPLMEAWLRGLPDVSTIIPLDSSSAQSEEPSSLLQCTPPSITSATSGSFSPASSVYSPGTGIHTPPSFHVSNSVSQSLSSTSTGESFACTAGENPIGTSSSPQSGPNLYVASSHHMTTRLIDGIINLIPSMFF